MEFAVQLGGYDGDYVLEVRVLDYQTKTWQPYHLIVVDDDFRKAWPGAPMFKVVLIPTEQKADDPEANAPATEIAASAPAVVAKTQAQYVDPQLKSAQVGGPLLAPVTTDFARAGWKVTLADGQELKEGVDCYWPDIPEAIAQVELAGKVIKGADRYWFLRRGAAGFGGQNEVFFIEIGGVFLTGGVQPEIDGYRLHRDGTWEPIGYRSLEALSSEHFAGVPIEQLPLKPGVRSSA